MATILVVDDDESMRALVRLHLANAGYEVTVAEDAMLAGRLLLESPPDLLVVDAEMPYLSGIDLVAALLADSTAPAIPILFITAHEQHRDKFDNMGVEYLIKPFKLEALLASVGKMLNR
jgi:DNA-binding response OmpR family regulator